jgi:hypothetical protein
MVTFNNNTSVTIPDVVPRLLQYQYRRAAYPSRRRRGRPSRGCCRRRLSSFPVGFRRTGHCRSRRQRNISNLLSCSCKHSCIPSCNCRKSCSAGLRGYFPRHHLWIKASGCSNPSPFQRIPFVAQPLLHLVVCAKRM